MALVVNVAGNLILLPAVGFMGAAWMTLATEVVVFGCTLTMILRHLGIRRPRVGRIGRTAAAAVVLGVALEGMTQAGAPLGVLAVTACIAYPALLFGLRALEVEDVRMVLRRGVPA